MSFEHVTSELINTAASLARNAAARQLEAIAMRLTDTLDEGAVNLETTTARMRRLLWAVDALADPSVAAQHVEADRAAWESLATDWRHLHGDLSPQSIGTVDLLVARLANDAPDTAPEL